MNTTTVQLLAAALERCSRTLEWYSVNADGNTPQNPDADDVEGITLAKQALAQYESEAAVQPAKLDSNESAGQLTDWRVLYRNEGDDENNVMCFQAEDAAHALEQFDECKGEGEVAVGALCEPCFQILPDSQGGHVYNSDEGTWITVNNVSLHLRVRDDEVAVDLLPLGREDDAAIASADAGFSLTALNALLDHDDTHGAIRDYCSVLSKGAIEAHLAEIDDEGIAQNIRDALTDQLA